MITTSGKWLPNAARDVRNVGLVDGFDAFFRAAVRDARELGAKEASAVWTGSVWLAAEAKGLGLVDRVETLDATVERLAAPLRAKTARARLRESIAG